MVNNIIQSNDPETDTFKCPKCNALWRSKGYYNYDEGGWVQEDNCPLGCRSTYLYFFKKQVKGNIIPRD